MKRLPSLAAAVGSIALTGAFAFAPASGQPSGTTATTPSPDPQPSASAPLPKRTLTPSDFKLGDLTADDVIIPKPTWSPPAGYAGSLQPEDWVQITGTDSCLNVRISPALVFHLPEGDQPVPTLNCLADGFSGQLSFGPQPKEGEPPPMPVQADGYWWWSLLGQGWVAEDWLIEAGAPPSGARPELAEAGLIAFMRADGVWVMNADGSEMRLLYPSNTTTTTITSIDWSPDGTSLAISMSTWAETETRFLTVLLAVDGTTTAEHPGLSEVSWSPDGAQLAGLRYTAADAQFGRSTPVVLELATGSDTTLGPLAWYSRGPEWAPDGSSLAFVCWSSTWQEQTPTGIVDREIECNGDGLRTVSPDGSTARVIAPVGETDGWGFEGPSWSPDSSTIATYTRGPGCTGYVLIDVASASQTTCFGVPQQTLSGGCGIGIEQGASDWTPDGRTLAYHWQSGTGQNGVALVEVATGERRMIPTTGASSISFSGDGAHLSYESAGYVWTADVDGSDVTRVTDGWLPAWQPSR